MDTIYIVYTIQTHDDSYLNLMSSFFLFYILFYSISKSINLTIESNRMYKKVGFINILFT